jgi:hypothetical protein
MPLPAAGQKVLDNMVKQYGADKGKEVFYASINAHKPGSEKWDPKKGGHPIHHRRRGK